MIDNGQPIIRNQILANNQEKSQQTIDERIQNSKEKLLENIDLLNKSIDKDTSELDKNKIVVMLIAKYGINPFANIDVKDVASDLGMNLNNASELFKRKDFPALQFTKPKKICWLSYLFWKVERRM